MKYQVGDYVKFEYGAFKGIGKIVEVGKGDYLIELPKEFHGRGHDGSISYGSKYKEDNYWFIDDRHIECKIEKPESENTKEETKVARFKVGDKVKVRSDLVVDEGYGALNWLSGSMSNLAGKVLTIKKVYDCKCYDFEETLFILSDESIECKVDGPKFKTVKEEVKKPKFKVGDRVRANALSNGNYSITNLNNNYEGVVKRVFEDGKFSTEDGFCDLDPRCFDLIEEVKHEEPKHKTEFIEPANEDIKVKDQFLYDHKVKTNGDIAFNKVKMLTLCFVKYNHWGKVYTFINPTGKVLKEGTKVLVDSAGRDNVAYIVSSVKVQAKHVDGLVYAMTGKKHLELKNVLGVYEVKIVTKETEVLDRYED